MRDIREELEKARNEVQRLDTEFKEELKKDFALSKEGARRRQEDGKGWEELLKAMPVDLAKLLEHDKADAKRAEAIFKELQPRLKTVPKEVLIRTQEHLALDDLLNLELVADPVRRWYSLNQAYDGDGAVDYYQSTDSNGVVEGSCGQKRLGGPAEVNPRSYAVGSGSGWQDYNSTVTQCWLWFQIPSSYIQRPGTLYVWPYFDIHGWYYVRANDGYFSSKEAKITLKMHLRLHRYNYQYAPWFTWVVRERRNGNIDEDSRVDYTGYHNDSKGVLQVLAGEAIWVQVIAELRAHAEGSGSYAHLDFQTDDNAIRIPRIVVYVP
jgi:hypothetical protein